jgi:hypothetical protein
MSGLAEFFQGGALHHAEAMLFINNRAKTMKAYVV